MTYRGKLALCCAVGLGLFVSGALGALVLGGFAFIIVKDGE